MSFIHQHHPDKGDGLKGRPFFLDSQKPDRSIPEPLPAAATSGFHTDMLGCAICSLNHCSQCYAEAALATQDPLTGGWKAILALATSLPATFSPNQSCRVQTGQEKIPEVCLGKPSWQQKDWDKPLKVHLNAKVHISRPKKKYKSFSCAGDKAATWHLSNKNYNRQSQLSKKNWSAWRFSVRSPGRTSTLWVSSRLDIVYGLL